MNTLQPNSAIEEALKGGASPVSTKPLDDYEGCRSIRAVLANGASLATGVGEVQAASTALAMAATIAADNDPLLMMISVRGMCRRIGSRYAALLQKYGDPEIVNRIMKRNRASNRTC